MKLKTSKRIIAMLITMAMIIALLPTAVFAVTFTTLAELQATLNVPDNTGLLLTHELIVPAADDGSVQTLTIPEGKFLNITSGGNLTFAKGTVEVNGKLVIENGGSLTTTDTFTFGANGQIVYESGSKHVYNGETIVGSDNTAYYNLTENSSITLNSSFTAEIDGTVTANERLYYHTKVEIGSVLNINDNFEVDSANLSNYGEINITDGKFLDVFGNCVNQGTFNGDVIVRRDATLYNYSTINGDVHVHPLGTFLKESKHIINGTITELPGAKVSRDISVHEDGVDNPATSVFYTNPDGILLNEPPYPESEYGYKFLYWSVFDGTDYQEIDLDTYNFTEDTAIYPIYDETVYEITFVSNYDNAPENKVLSTKYNNNAQAHILSNFNFPPLQRAGYYFVSWNTAADGSGKDISEFLIDSDTDENYAFAENTTFHAQWTPVNIEQSAAELEAFLDTNPSYSTYEEKDAINAATLRFLSTTRPSLQEAIKDEFYMSALSEIEPLFRYANSNWLRYKDYPTAYEGNFSDADKILAKRAVTTRFLEIAFIGLNAISAEDAEYFLGLTGGGELVNIGLNVTQLEASTPGAVRMDISPYILAFGNEVPKSSMIQHAPVDLTIRLPESFDAKFADIKHFLDSGEVETFSKVPVHMTSDGVLFVEATVTNFSQFEIIPVVEDAPTEETPTTDVPQTGDTSNVSLWTLLALIGVCGVAFLSKKRIFNK